MSATRVMLNLLVHEAGDAAFKTATTAALGSFLVDAATGFKHIISKDHNVDFFKKDDDVKKENDAKKEDDGKSLYSSCTQTNFKR